MNTLAVSKNIGMTRGGRKIFEEWRRSSMGKTIIDVCRYGRRAPAGGSYRRKSNSQPIPESLDPRTLGSSAKTRSIASSLDRLPAR